jgi:GAF domain-containing protein
MAGTEDPIGEESLIGEESTFTLITDFSQTAQALFSPSNVQDTLTRVVALAVASIEGCDLAGVFLVEGDVVTTPVYTDPVVVDLDALQHRIGEGPCLDAVTHRVPFYAGDLSDDPRWSRLGAEATGSGIRSLLALPLFANGTLGTLNLYAHYPQAFGVIDRARGVLLAGLADLALSAAQTHEDGERRVANLHAALATREVIGQAQGILMERERITAWQAFDILRRASQHLNVKLRDVAQSLVDTGEQPNTG